MSTARGDGGGAEARGPTVHRVMLGAQLHQLRTRAGITPDQAGHEIRASRSKISRLENGRVGFKERDIEDLLTLYGVTDSGARDAIRQLARLANAPGWWAPYADVTADWFEEYLGLETAASVIRTFELQSVNGLFQTPEYARAVTLLGNSAAPAQEIDRRVALRIKRQDVLTGHNPPMVWSVMDEGVLRRPIGGQAVMRGQLERVLELSALRNVTFQVVPFGAGGHAGAGGSFSVLRFDGDVPDVVYIEQLNSALYLDKLEAVDHYLEVMNNLCTKALPPSDTIEFIAELTREL